MIDKYNRKIDYLRISVTDRCNLRCSYCMPSAGVQFRTMEEILTYEEIILVCRAAALSGIRKIKITGGEPLVRKGIAQLIGKIAKIPGITEVTMTTVHRSHLPLVLGDDPTIFDTDNAVCHLCNFFVVSDHYDCLGELLTGDFQKAQYILTGFGIQITCGQC